MGVDVAETFAALGDPVRYAIVDRLVAGDATVGELAASFTITLQAVSQQIGTLERAGLVTRHR
jgi:DNA-binding transcriptional ArsR family regulator